MRDLGGVNCSHQKSWPTAIMEPPCSAPPGQSHLETFELPKKNRILFSKLKTIHID